MAKNKMSEVAKLLGVELEEEFRINVSPLEFKLTESGLLYWSNASQMWERSRSIEELLIGQYEIIKISKPILDEKEKKYLSNVIRPYKNKNKVESICKYRVSDSKERLSIYIKNDIGIDLPKFEKGTMYKGMKLNKEYTLEELGL